MALRVSQVGAYIETSQKSLRASQVGAYIEVDIKKLRVSAVGAYVEVIAVLQVAPDPASVIASSSDPNVELIVVIGIQADNAVNDWTNELGESTNLYQSIDEEVFDDADYVQSPLSPAGEVYRFKLNPIDVPPEIDEYHIITYRYKKQDPTDRIDLKVRLLQGTETIVEWTHINIPDTWITQERTLTEAQAASITDYTDLYIEFEAMEF